MKFSVHGFYQIRAVELGLTNDDLLVLRWFVDFAGTEKMKTIIEQDGIYYWVNYATILEDLPVLKITKDRLKRKHFDKLCEAKVLKHKHIKQGGSFSYYAYGINYDALVYLQNDTPTVEMSQGAVEITQGYGENNETPTVEITQGYGENTATKINLLNNPSINNKSIKDNKISNNQLEQEFELIWKEYPNKKGKSNALKSYIKARKKGTTYEEVLNGLENYVKYITIEKKEQKYIKHGSTWFRNECWNDDYTITRKPTTKDLVIDISDF